MNQAFDILDAAVSSIDRGLDAAKGNAGSKGRLWIATDTNQVYFDDGASWSVVLVGTGGSLATHNHSSTGQGGLLTGARTDTYLVFDLQPSNPAAVSGRTILFAGANGSLWLRQSDGTLADLATGSGGGGLTDHNHTGTGDGGALTDALVDTFLAFQGVGAGNIPGAPGAGVVRVYAKSQDSRLYWKDSTNTERRIDLRLASELSFTPTANISATDVQAAIAMLDAAKASINHFHTASQIGFAPTGSLSSVNVQAAIDEVNAEKADLAHTHADTTITHSPSGNIAATNVGAAIVELDNEKLAVLNGIATSLEITNFIVLDEQPAHPNVVGPNKGLLYVLATDKHVYLRDSTGTTYDLTLVGSSGGLTAHGHTGSTDGGVLAAPQVNGYIEVVEGTAPGQPPSTRGRIYAKGDHHLYWKDQANVEYDLTATGGASVWTSSNGLIYPVTITDRLSIGSLAATPHSFRVLKTGNTGTLGAPEAPIFVDQTITSVANPAPDVGAINAVIRYQAVAGGGVADLASTGLDIRAEYGLVGAPATGTQHAATFISDVIASSNLNNEVTPIFAYARARGTPGTPVSLWGMDLSVHGPINTQAGVMHGPVFCVNNYYNGSPQACESAGMIVVTRQGAGAGAELGHSSATTYPLQNGIIIAGTSTGNVGMNVGLRVGNPIGSVNASASRWFPTGTSQVGIGITMSGLTQKAMLLDGGNTRVQWGQDAAASVAWLDLAAASTLQLDGRFRVQNPGAVDNGTNPLLDLGANVAQANAWRLWNNTGALTGFVAGASNQFLQGTVLGDVGFVTAQRLLIGQSGITTAFVSVDSANRRVGVGTNAPNAAAILHVAATDRGVLLCPMTAAQFDAIGSKPAGLYAYITTNNRYEYWDGSARQPMAGSGVSGVSDHNHTATAGDGGPLTNSVFDGYEDHLALASPIPPTAGQRHYLRTDNLPVYRDTGGVDYPASLQPARRHLTATASYDPPLMAHGAGDTVDVTCAGAQIGDCTMMGFSVPLPVGVSFTAQVFSTNVVRCSLKNDSGTNQDVAAGTVRVTVLGYT